MCLSLCYPHFQHLINKRMEKELNYLSERDDEISSEIMKLEDRINECSNDKEKEALEDLVYYLAKELELIDSIMNYITQKELS